MRSPGGDRRAGMLPARDAPGPRCSRPAMLPARDGAARAAGVSRAGGRRERAARGRHGAGAGGERGRPARGQTGRGRDGERGTRPVAARGAGRRQGTVGGNGSRTASWHQDSPRSAPRPRASFVTLGSWIFSRFRFRERFGPLKSAADGRVWCHNFAKPERNEVVAPHARLRRVPVSCPARCKRNHEWCHNFAKHGKNEVVAPEGPGNLAYPPPGDGCPRGCNGGRIRGQQKVLRDLNPCP
jgi:hypothetical protein